MNDTSKTNDRLVISTTPEKEFSGYTLSQLRYQRAMTALKCQFAKEKALRGIDHVRNRSPFAKKKQSSGSSGNISKITSLAMKGLSSLNYYEYAMIGFSIFGTGRKIWKALRGRKK